MEDPSILDSCSMKIFLQYSWLNKSLALPLGCDVGPFSLFGRHYLWAPICNVGLASLGGLQLAKVNFHGAIFLSLYVLPNCKFFNFLYSLWGFSSFFVCVCVLFTYCHLRCFGGLTMVWNAQPHASSVRFTAHSVGREREKKK